MNQQTIGTSDTTTANINLDSIIHVVCNGGATGYEIDVYRDKASFEDDVAIDEFIDEIEAWVIDALKAIGCDTAKSVLDISAEDLVSRTDLETETVEDVLNILGSEFED